MDFTLERIGVIKMETVEKEKTCQVCGLKGDHKLTYTNPSLECIKALQAEIKKERETARWWRGQIILGAE
jgi:hypothetical protein